MLRIRKEIFNQVFVETLGPLGFKNEKSPQPDKWVLKNDFAAYYMATYDSASNDFASFSSMSISLIDVEKVLWQIDTPSRKAAGTRDVRKLYPGTLLEPNWVEKHNLGRLDSTEKIQIQAEHLRKYLLNYGIPYIQKMNEPKVILQAMNTQYKSRGFWWPAVNSRQGLGAFAVVVFSKLCNDPDYLSKLAVVEGLVTNGLVPRDRGWRASYEHLLSLLENLEPKYTL